MNLIYSIIVLFMVAVYPVLYFYFSHSMLLTHQRTLSIIYHVVIHPYI
jgi:hypothetical protein